MTSGADRIESVSSLDDADIDAILLNEMHHVDTVGAFLAGFTGDDTYRNLDFGQYGEQFYVCVPGNMVAIHFWLNHVCLIPHSLLLKNNTVRKIEMNS